MTPELIPALLGFALVTSATPGPNNLMLMASGANFGFRRTLPHMLGIGIGFTLMIALVGIGLSAAFDVFPVLHEMLKVAALAYMSWLAWNIAHAGAPGARQTDAPPMTFLEAAAFQWVNPKAWTMALSAIALYAPDRSLLSVITVAVIFGAVNLPSVSCWPVLGGQIRRFLTSDRRLQVFNWTMAAALMASLVPVLLH